MLPILYIVIPCYNEEEVLDETARRILSLFDRMEDEGLVASGSRMLPVDDGSCDKTWQIIERLHTDDPRVSGVKLAANSGHQNALLAGLLTASDKADIIVSIDADLQDDAEVIPEMVRKYHEGNDIVYGVRKSRQVDNWFKRTSATLFYRFMQKLGAKTIYNHADYRLMSRRAVLQLGRYRERNLFLRGLVPLLGYQSDVVYYDRARRFAGESKYPLGKMLNFALDGITSFSIRPLRLLFHLGLFFILFAVCILVWVLYKYITGHVVTGWSSLILSIWFVGGCVLTGLGITGEYVGKIYMEVKDRPRYNIELTFE